ncbi:zinc finger protein [Thecamonas trahens ATCC 50062]|uniref:Zinc finger protein n=1 Tax=Thecamonas trahens ATCC 50062 TaxID=461836 RepID=A0A0L0DM19_THETB|nr:zinc finger protein [Thecamonas trahens ATCC 50062]KNC53362.1 zinc finger protein [Thecamonas trahens ATCC 50062]|eukprot:XP_013754408.1 zinc finger protein [Thecamonas trahens ATCC 50062]
MDQAQGKTGSGAVASASVANRARRERIRALALTTIDLKSDPFFTRTHHGHYECSLCLTHHSNEGSYLAHTQARKHRQNLAKRQARQAQAAEAAPLPQPAAAAGGRRAPRRATIGVPHHAVERLLDPETQQVGLRISIAYPEIADGIQPRHQFMSAYEQKHEAPDKDYLYLVFAADPYSNVAVKIPNRPLDRAPDKFFTNWDWDNLEYSLTLHYALSEPESEPEPSATNQSTALPS